MSAAPRIAPPVRDEYELALAPAASIDAIAPAAGIAAARAGDPAAGAGECGRAAPLARLYARLWCDACATRNGCARRRSRSR
ncbi:hypothetical protein AAFM48_17300 [Burkholderia pseudomallei]